MSSRNWKLRIQDILQAIESIQTQTQNRTFEELSSNQTILKSVLYDFIVIGEAAMRIDQTIQNRYPQVPWRLMVDLRNVVAHQYFEIKLNIIWSTIQDDLPPLVPQLETILQENQES